MHIIMKFKNTEIDRLMEWWSEEAYELALLQKQ